MFPKMDPAKMQAMMKKMGVKTENIEADEVIIKKPDGEIHITSPNVTVVEVQGQKTFQIMGNIEESAGEPTQPFTDDDVKMVTEQAEVSEDEARKALEETGGDIAEAILKVKKE